MVNPVQGSQGPGGTSGPDEPITVKGDPDTISQSLLLSDTVTVVNSSDPDIFPPISELIDIIAILDELRAALNAGESQRAELSRALFSSIAAMLRTDENPTLQDTSGSTSTEIEAFFDKYFFTLSLLQNIAKSSKRVTDYTNNVFDFLYFNLKTKLDPTKLEALAERYKVINVESDQASNTGVSAPGSGVLLATQVIGLSNPDLNGITGRGIFESFLEKEGVPLPADFQKLLQLLILKILSVSAFSSIKPSLGRLGVKGANLAGNRQGVEALTAGLTLEGLSTAIRADALRPVVEQFLSERLGLGQAQVQNLLDPFLAALSFSTILAALNNLGRTLGAPALGGAIASSIFTNDPNIGALSNITTTDDIIRNALAQPYLIRSLVGDLSQQAGLPNSDSIRIAKEVIAGLAPSGSLSQDELIEAIKQKLAALGIPIDAAGSIANILTLRIVSETELTNRLVNISLDGILDLSGINQEELLREIQGILLSTTGRIAGAFSEAAAETADVRERLAKEAVVDGIKRAFQERYQIGRQLREDLIGAFAASGASLTQALNTANSIMTSIDSQSQRLSRRSESLNVQDIRSVIHTQMSDLLRTDLGNRAEDVADALDETLFGPTQRLEARRKEEIRRPTSIANQLEDIKDEIIRYGGDKTIEDIKEAFRKSSRDNYDINWQYKQATEPASMLVNSTLNLLGGTEDALSTVKHAGPETPVGVVSDIPA